MYFEMAMIGLNLLQGSKAKDYSKYSIKSENMKLEDISNQYNFLKETSKFNFKNLNEAYSKNFGRLIEAGTDNEQALREAMENERVSYLKVAGKKSGVDVSSFNADAENYINAKNEVAYAKIQVNTLRQGENYTKEYLQGIINTNATKLNALNQLGNQELEAYNRTITIEANKDINSLGSLVNMAQIGADIFGDYKTSGTDSFLNWAKSEFTFGASGTRQRGGAK